MFPVGADQFVYGSTTARRCACRFAPASRRDGKVEIVDGVEPVSRSSPPVSPKLSATGPRCGWSSTAALGQPRPRPRRPGSQRRRPWCLGHLHPPTGLRDRAVADRRAARPGVVLAAAVREYPKIDEPSVTVDDQLPRRVRRHHRDAGHQAARGLDRRHRGRRRAHVDLAPRAAARSRCASGSTAIRTARRPTCATASRGCARACRRSRRTGDREGRGRRQSDHLAGVLQRRAVAAGGVGHRQPLRQAAAADTAGRGRRAHLRRAQVLDAHLARSRPAGRIQPDAERRRGRAAAAERRGAVRAHREPAARVHGGLADRPAARVRSSRTWSCAPSTAIRCASATSARVGGRAAGRAHHRALQRPTRDLARA